MSEIARFWTLIATVAAGTLVLRSLPIWLHGRVSMPQWLGRALRRVPSVALAALVVPGSLYLRTNAGALELAPARTIAAGVALVVAARTRSVLATLGAGMVSLWIVQAIL